MQFIFGSDCYYLKGKSKHFYVKMKLCYNSPHFSFSPHFMVLRILKYLRLEIVKLFELTSHCSYARGCWLRYVICRIGQTHPDSRLKQKWTYTVPSIQEYSFKYLIRHWSFKLITSIRKQKNCEKWKIEPKQTNRKAIRPFRKKSFNSLEIYTSQWIHEQFYGGR